MTHDLHIATRDETILQYIVMFTTAYSYTMQCALRNYQYIAHHNVCCLNAVAIYIGIHSLHCKNAYITNCKVAS